MYQKNTQKKIHKYCLRCGRALKSEENKERGYGPVCWKKLKNKHMKGKLWKDE